MPQIQKSNNPVPIFDFFISAEQTGIPTRRRNEDQFSVIEEYAKSMAHHPDIDDDNIYFDTEDSTTSFFNEGTSQGFPSSASHTERTSSPADLSVHAAFLSNALPVNLFNTQHQQEEMQE